MSRGSRERFARVVRDEPVDVAVACLLVGAEVDPELDVDGSLAVLDALAAQVRPLVGGTLEHAAEALRVVLGEQAGFAGFEQDYDDVRSSLLHEVLRRARGLPILLSVVWVEVAQRAGLSAYAMGLPGHVLVAIGKPDGEHVVVDPFSGGRPAQAPAAFPAMPAVELLTRLLTNVRVLTTRQERSLEAARTRLWATELSLLLPRHPAALRRERGELLVRLGEHLLGATALEDYAGLVEDADPQQAEAVRREARQARSRLN